MKPIKITAGAVAIGLVVAGLALGNALNAAAAPTPQVEMDGHHFYTDAQMDAVWTDVRRTFSAEIDPAALPAIFPGERSENALYEVGIAEMVAAQYWRCGWLDERLSGGKEIESSELEAMMATYSSLPKIAEHDLTGYTSTRLAELSRRFGLDSAAETLYFLDCKGVES